MRSILDPNFKYVNAASTDLRKTFNRVRKEISTAALREAKASAVPTVVESGKADTSRRLRVAK